MTQTTRRRTRRTLETPAVPEVSDEQQRDEFWSLTRRLLDQLDIVAVHKGLPAPSMSGGFQVSDHELHCYFEAMEAVRGLPPLLTAGPARLEGAQ